MYFLLILRSPGRASAARAGANRLPPRLGCGYRRRRCL